MREIGLVHLVSLPTFNVKVLPLPMIDLCRLEDQVWFSTSPIPWWLTRTRLVIRSPWRCCLPAITGPSTPPLWVLSSTTRFWPKARTRLECKCGPRLPNSNRVCAVVDRLVGGVWHLMGVVWIVYRLGLGCVIGVFPRSSTQLDWFNNEWKNPWLFWFLFLLFSSGSLLMLDSSTDKQDHSQLIDPSGLSTSVQNEVELLDQQEHTH